MSPLRIAIVVQGRFHAFDLARALLAAGHEGFIFTNYPAAAVARFGFPAIRVRTCVSHGVVDRVAMQLSHRTPARYPERRLHEWFGRWAAKEVAKENWDVIHCWSGVS